MMVIKINDSDMPIDEKDYATLCENFRKRTVRVLYLRDDLQDELLTEYDVKSYINALIWDIYGAYVVFGECRFLNCICELEGIKENLSDVFVRKKILDVANFIKNINKV